MKRFYVISVCVLICIQLVDLTKGAKCKECSSLPIFKRLACRLKGCAVKKNDPSSTKPPQSSTSLPNPKPEEVTSQAFPSQEEQDQSSPAFPITTPQTQPAQTSKPPVENSTSSSSNDKIVITVSPNKTLIGSSSKGATPSSINQEIHPIGGVV